MDAHFGQGMLGGMRDADVLLVNDRIQAVGQHLAAPHDAEVIDGTGKIVMPGFIDTHDHLWQSYMGVRLSTAELVNTGVTTAVDWSHAFNPGFVRGDLRALNDSGMRYAFAMNGAQLDGSELHVKLHVHLLENISQVDEHPMGLLQAAGAFDLGRDLFTAHEVHLSDSDIATLAQILSMPSLCSTARGMRAWIRRSRRTPGRSFGSGRARRT